MNNEKTGQLEEDGKSALNKNMWEAGELCYFALEYDKWYSGMVVKVHRATVSVVSERSGRMYRVKLDKIRRDGPR